jgi:hypothetical protein
VPYGYVDTRIPQPRRRRPLPEEPLQTLDLPPLPKPPPGSPAQGAPARRPRGAPRRLPIPRDVEPENHVQLHGDCSTEGLKAWMGDAVEKAQACLKGKHGPIPPELETALKYLANLPRDLEDFFTGDEEPESFTEGHWGEARTLQKYSESQPANKPFEGPSGRLFAVVKNAEGRVVVPVKKGKRAKRPETPRFQQTHATKPKEVSDGDKVQ